MVLFKFRRMAKFKFFTREFKTILTHFCMISSQSTQKMTNLKLSIHPNLGFLIFNKKLLVCSYFYTYQIHCLKVLLNSLENQSKFVFIRSLKLQKIIKTQQYTFYSVIIGLKNLFINKLYTQKITL